MISRIFQNLGMLVVAYWYALLHGKAIGVPRDPQTILVAQTAKLGDMICATPVFRALRAKYPNARIIVMGDSLNREILAGNTDVDDYVVNGRGFYALVRAVRALRVNIGYVLVPDSIALAAVFLGGAQLVIAPKVVGGYCPWQTKTYRLLRWLVRSVPHRMGHYAPREYLKLLEPLGIHTEDTTKHLNYSDEARKNAGVFLRAHGLTEKKFAIISPSAGNKIKNWPADRFARVAEHLVSKGFPVVVIGGPRDKSEVAAMMGAVEKPGNIIDALERFSIDELKAFIAQAGLFVSVDTGPIYIAEAFDVPTVDIVGPMDEREQPPVGKNHKVVVSPRSAAAIHIMNARVYDEQEARRQTEAISVEMVCEAGDGFFMFH